MYLLYPVKVPGNRPIPLSGKRFKTALFHPKLAPGSSGAGSTYSQWICHVFVAKTMIFKPDASGVVAIIKHSPAKSIINFM
jgi:hypothetical protein